jgi:acyl-CoA synthetase (AMP-forming)/AMP-acid ligase II
VFHNFSDALAHNAARKPGHPALVEGDTEVSYSALERKVDSIAHGLQARGVTPGTIVGIALADTIDYVAAMLAIIRAGATLIALDVRWTTEERRRVAAHFGARFVLLEPGAPAVEEATSLTVSALDQGGTPERVAIDPDAPLLISLSSGTTGRPKGPMLSHRQMAVRSLTHWVSIGFNEHDRHMVATPLYFGGGRGFTLSHLMLGATVVLFPPPYQPDALLEAIARCRITSTFLVPTLLRRLLELPDRGAALLPGLRILLSGGSLLHAAERRAAMQRLSPHFMNLYSSTEGGGVSLLRPEHGDDKAGSVGLPVYMNEVQVVDDNGVRCPPGAVGRIRQRAPWIPAGFHNDPEASADAFRDGWYYPGDLGKMDEDGFLSIVGRSKDMLIRGGVNIYPNEIEAVLCEHAAVLDAAVVGRPHAELGEEPVAFVVVSTDVAPETLADHCRRTLAPYKVPRTFYFVDDLPKSSMGKVAKPQLVERLKAMSAAR